MDQSIRSESFDTSDMGLVGLGAIDMHKEDVSQTAKSIRVDPSRLGIQSGSFNLDVNVWLSKAAEQYNTSRNIRDYVIVPVPVNITELPNTNGDAFSLEEWLTFNPDQGRLAYQTFVGKPTFIEHNNKDYRQAMGMIFDSNLSKLQNFRGNHARLTLLLAFDRTRCQERCDRILSGELNTYSKGTTYKAYKCSICGQLVTPRHRNFCSHTAFNKPTYLDGRTGRLVYRDCKMLTGFECSSVDDPAFACAATYKEHLLRMA
ncbi:head maturation protease [Erwinia phage vB_EamM_Alexandra]|uniref:Uncharacterized protein n=1 Tax=Erwinia phage vB_EamM_Alexandra TaxID=2201424 RepID=A0A2Z4QEF6_9CAUD|nr:head maturation protease [Erwinia phage vB_EamM_Alexandra]AWY08419.1 hypothetical protein Alexandra_147 [Erwinia phage vB_EamM_Alexandra]